MMLTAQQLAEKINGKLIGDGTVQITCIANTESPAPGSVCFVQDTKWLKRLEETEVACILVSDKITSSSKTIIQVAHPKIAWARLLEFFFPPRSFSGKVSGQAAVASSARIGKNTTIEPFAHIGENAVIGDGAVICSFVSVGDNVKIGAKTILHPGVVIYENCIIGQSVTIHAQTVIGSDGFGYVATPDKQIKVPQVGNVIIEDEVEIGACTTIDRATIGSTVIGKDCKIDNQVQIAHNVVIGPHTALSAQTGISGSSKIGAHVTMGGKAGLGDHVEIGDWVMVGAGAGFPSGKKIGPKQIVFGQPARPYHEARKQIGAQLRSAEMYDDIKKLKGKLAELEKRLADTPPSIT
ncbi:MAG: UDP-3-O-(3-hydroxymyristoyl)glucosamine N-acyltransferase [Candidatus Omnitrophica bacterium]|nr:UDP-3-O-(3-hydroxymyristoyl)glucosamine N-acyltransferase [Candidatus Omnitrophota bacterium]